MEIGGLRPSELQDLLESHVDPGPVDLCRTTAAAWPGSVSPCRVVAAACADDVSQSRVTDAGGRGANFCRTMPNACRVLPA